jgi:hypothetical protein
MIVNMNNYTFTFGSRYGDKRTATMIEQENGQATFHVHGESHYVRGGEGMYDFEGGPFYGVGGDFHGRGDILSVVPAPEKGCLVVVKLNKDAKKEIQKWNESRPKIEALKQEIGEWLDNGE